MAERMYDGPRFTIEGCRIWIEAGSMHVQPKEAWVEPPSMSCNRLSFDGAQGDPPAIVVHDLDGRVSFTLAGNDMVSVRNH